MNFVQAFEAGTLPKANDGASRWLRQLWATYWESRTRAATVAILRALDDRTLKDMGLHRSEIGSLVYGTRGERPFR